MNAAIDFESLNGFSRYLIVEKMDEDVINHAKDIFEKYQKNQVIVKGEFSDDKWELSNEKKIYRFDFSIDEKKYNANTLKWTGCSYQCFCDCLKAYLVFKLGIIELNGIGQLLHDLSAIVETELEEIIASSKNRNNLESFLLMLPGANVGLDCILERLQEMPYQLKTCANPRKLYDFKSYFRFNDTLNNVWLNFDQEQKKYYFPVYFWWQLTAILPLRVTEFLLIPRDCIYVENNEYKLTVRRTKLKKGNERIRYKVKDDYSLHTYIIPQWLGDEISGYIDATKADEQSVLGTIFIPVSGNKYGYFTYAMMQRRLQEFISEVMNDEHFSIRLGDTRHLAMINLILSGGSPVICRELAGHESVDISSNYYANLSSAVESIVYEHYHRGKGDATLLGNLKFPVSMPDAVIPVLDGWCDYIRIMSGDISECIKSYSEISGLGDCRYCSHYYPQKQGLTLEISNQRKIELDDDSRFLIRMIEIVRKGRGYEEDIASALSRVQTSAYKYAKAYYKKIMKENEDGKTKEE